MEEKMNKFWTSILITVTVFSLSLTVTRIGKSSGSTTDAAVANGEAFRVPLTYADGYYGYASGNAYATDYVDGVANDGSLTVSARCGSFSMSLGFPFEAGGGFIITIDGDFLDNNLRCRGHGFVDSRFGLDSSTHEVP